MARAVARARSSNDAAQPTQYRISGAVSPGSSTRTSRPSAHAARSDCALPHGFEERPTSRSIVPASAGKRDSAITRLRRRSTMWSTCSIETGHSCTHAPQVTQSQTTSSVTAPGTSADALSPVEHRRPLVEETVAEAHDEKLRRQILAGRPRGTDVLAAPALGARHGVEHLLPRHVDERPRAEPERSLVLDVEVERLQPSPRTCPAEPDVDPRGRDVEVLRVREVDEEGEDREHVEPDEDALACVEPGAVAASRSRSRSTPATSRPATR